MIFTGTEKMKENKKSNILKWFIKEGALRQEGNVYYAPRAFTANSIISWAKQKAPTLKQDEIEYIMKTIRLFLQKKLDLKWEGDSIEILSKIVDNPHMEESQIQTKGVK